MMESPLTAGQSVTAHTTDVQMGPALATVAGEGPVAGSIHQHQGTAQLAVLDEAGPADNGMRGQLGERAPAGPEGAVRGHYGEPAPSGYGEQFGHTPPRPRALPVRPGVGAPGAAFSLRSPADDGV
jgi:hypothetical protein